MRKPNDAKLGKSENFKRDIYLYNHPKVHTLDVTISKYLIDNSFGFAKFGNAAQAIIHTCVIIIFRKLIIKLFKFLLLFYSSCLFTFNFVMIVLFFIFLLIVMLLHLIHAYRVKLHNSMTYFNIKLLICVHTKKWTDLYT